MSDERIQSDGSASNASGCLSILTWFAVLWIIGMVHDNSKKLDKLIEVHGLQQERASND